MNSGVNHPIEYHQRFAIQPRWIWLLCLLESSGTARPGNHNTSTSYTRTVNTKPAAPARGTPGLTTPEERPVIKPPPPVTSDRAQTEKPDWLAAQAAIRSLAGKWMIPIIAALANGPLRYTDLHRAIGPAVSEKVLVETLRRMEEEDLIVRLDVSDHTRPTAFATRSAYELTEFAETLRAPLAALGDWRATHASTEKSRLD